MTIRTLDPITDLGLVFDFYQSAPEYWVMADGVAPDLEKARLFFSEGPPGCDLAKSHRLGYFVDGRLSGLAELSYGFPGPADPYLGLMMFGPWAQGQGHGVQFLDHIETLARGGGGETMYLAVLDDNPRGGAFWRRMGFGDTGHRGQYDIPGHTHQVRRLAKPL